jgi:hypothetical protein
LTHIKPASAGFFIAEQVWINPNSKGRERMQSSIAPVAVVSASV